MFPVVDLNYFLGGIKHVFQRYYFYKYRLRILYNIGTYCLSIKMRPKEVKLLRKIKLLRFRSQVGSLKLFVNSLYILLYLYCVYFTINYS